MRIIPSELSPVGVEFRRNEYDCRHATYYALRELGFDAPRSLIDLPMYCVDAQVLEGACQESEGFWEILGTDIGKAQLPGDVIVLSVGEFHLVPVVGKGVILNGQENSSFKLYSTRVLHKAEVVMVVRPTRRIA